MTNKLIQIAREHSDATKDERGRESFCFDEYGLSAFRAAVLADVGDVEPVAWGIFDSQGFYETRHSESSAIAFCEKYNSRDIDPLKPYSVQALYSAATVAALVAERDALRADAGRYRWLAGHCRSTNEHWGGRWSIVIEGPCPKSHDSEDDFDAAIDAAIAAEGKT